MRRRSTRSTRLGVISAFAVVAALAACGTGGGNAGGGDKKVDTTAPIKGSITFQTWSLKGDKFSPYFTALVKDFEAKNPGTTINWVDQPGDGYPEKVTSQVTSNSLPDVINLPPDIAYSVVKAGALLDLAKNVPTLKTDYVKSGLDAYSYQGQAGTYGFPWYLGTDVNYWNTGMFKRDGLEHHVVPDHAGRADHGREDDARQVPRQGLPDEPQARAQRLRQRRREADQRGRHEVHLQHPGRRRPWSTSTRRRSRRATCRRTC